MYNIKSNLNGLGMAQKARSLAEVVWNEVPIPLVIISKQMEPSNAFHGIPSDLYLGDIFSLNLTPV